MYLAILLSFFMWSRLSPFFFLGVVSVTSRQRLNTLRPIRVYARNSAVAENRGERRILRPQLPSRKRCLYIIERKRGRRCGGPSRIALPFGICFIGNSQGQRKNRRGMVQGRNRKRYRPPDHLQGAHTQPETSGRRDRIPDNRTSNRGTDRPPRRVRDPQPHPPAGQGNRPEHRPRHPRIQGDPGSSHELADKKLPQKGWHHQGHPLRAPGCQEAHDQGKDGAGAEGADAAGRRGGAAAVPGEPRGWVESGAGVRDGGAHLGQYNQN